ncbi:metallopeptidase family protein [Paenarthrobacter sp. Z7-10]|uniref:metallopeptidase family protein n=1 Tax=Paenarthrobacter sp. Z7-10 TaxID=2787635 RepID=UPI0022A922B3|nr:metallopeptidase family protein [Paenarthrobacter sp. Z7-10]MCZ2403253.1 metallopeptidase family protein [Paenarthrobacter sp. Z7-10]
MEFESNVSGFSITLQPRIDGSVTSRGRSFRARRRNRHGRGLRGDLLLPPLPGIRTRGDKFDEVVMESAERLNELWGAAMEAVNFIVEDIPGSLEELVAAGERAPLGICRAAGVEGAASIIIYRRPIEQIADNFDELREIVHEVVIEQAAGILNVAPETVDPIFRRPRRF